MHNIEPGAKARENVQKAIKIFLGFNKVSAYLVFLIFFKPAPFSTDTKNTLIPDFLTQKNPQNS